MESFTRVDKGASHDTTNVFVELLVALHVVEVGLVRTVVGCDSCSMRLTYVGGCLQFFTAEFQFFAQFFAAECKKQERNGIQAY